MRYLKKLNGMCSGFVFARWHNSLIFKKYPVWREIQNCRRTDWPFPIFPHISRSIWDIINFQTVFVQESCVLSETFHWFSKKNPVWRENPKWPPHRLTVSDFPYISRIRYLYIYKLSCLDVFQRKTNTGSHDFEIPWKNSSYGFQLSRRLNGRRTLGDYYRGVSTDVKLVNNIFESLSDIQPWDSLQGS